MKVAVPECRGRVSPVFDVAERIVLVDLARPESDVRVTEELGRMGPHARVRRLAELQVDVLVCGAISWSLEALIAAGGIRVVRLVCGDVDEIVRAFRDGTLDDDRFAMPGCCGKRRPGRQRRCRGGGGGRRGAREDTL
ncbi:MAG: hypothetical protein GXY58_10340 [Planctomycetaceae bacterium]|nr:hypothetical protein [Planctomycetaceae bacterium]